jgi:hypothetical protein
MAFYCNIFARSKICQQLLLWIMKYLPWKQPPRGVEANHLASARSNARNTLPRRVVVQL